mmetsp:Transcript_30184/g.39765  ORF Transcript_30184/g.39765 Transcript_30184/m.39765 type:complete len:605 (-) Transcript_30184:170-1984(-)
MGGALRKKKGSQEETPVVRFIKNYKLPEEFLITPEEFQKLSEEYLNVKGNRGTLSIERMLDHYRIRNVECGRSLLSLFGEKTGKGKLCISLQGFIATCWITCPIVDGHNFYTFALPFGVEDAKTDGSIFSQYKQILNSLMKTYIFLEKRSGEHVEVEIEESQEATQAKMEGESTPAEEKSLEIQVSDIISLQEVDRRPTSVEDYRKMVLENKGTKPIEDSFDFHDHNLRNDANTFVQKHTTMFYAAFQLREQFREDIAGVKFWKTCSKRLKKKKDKGKAQEAYSNWRLRLLMQALNERKPPDKESSALSLDFLNGSGSNSPSSQPSTPSGKVIKKSTMKKRLSHKNTLVSGKSDFEVDPRLREAVNDPRERRRRQRSNIVREVHNERRQRASHHATVDSLGPGINVRVLGDRGLDPDPLEALPLLVSRIVKHPVRTSANQRPCSRGSKQDVLEKPDMRQWGSSNMSLKSFASQDWGKNRNSFPPSRSSQSLYSAQGSSNRTSNSSDQPQLLSDAKSWSFATQQTESPTTQRAQTAKNSFRSNRSGVGQKKIHKSNPVKVKVRPATSSGTQVKGPPAIPRKQRPKTQSIGHRAPHNRQGRKYSAP